MSATTRRPRRSGAAACAPMLWVQGTDGKRSTAGARLPGGAGARRGREYATHAHRKGQTNEAAGDGKGDERALPCATEATTVAARTAARASASGGDRNKGVTRLASTQGLC